MNDSNQFAAPPADPGGPAREALELIYRLVAALELVPNVAVHSIDRDGVVRFWNNSCEKLFGIGKEAIGRHLNSLGSRLDRQEEFDRTIESVWNTARSAPASDYQLERLDGLRRWVHSIHFPVMRDGQPLEVFCMEIDISERKSREATLVQSAQVFDNCRDAILIADEDRVVAAINQAYVDLTGFTVGEVVGTEMLKLGASPHDRSFYAQIWEYVEAQKHWQGELIGQRKDGSEFPMWASLTCIPGPDRAPCSYMAMLSDITERKRVEEKTRHLAEHDFLTDLPNRVLFLDRLQQALVAARRKHGKVAVMFIDLDRFKGINDSFGHQVGDVVLKEVASRLSRCVRGVDTVSRQGGDEFVVILADIKGVDQAAHVAGTVMHAVAQPVKWLDHSISLSVSIGVAISPADGDDIDTLLNHADVAMYHAKQDGRNAMRFFSPEMNAHVVERVQIENMLRNALKNDEFELAYQPEIDILSGRATGVEALIRWRHPNKGLLLPQEFIPIAEECGLMVPIGEWVLRTACAQARAWRDQGLPMVVSVNLSHLQFIHNDLVKSVDEALRGSGLAPAFLDLEITESIITNGDEHTIATLGALRRLGVQLTIDNFGTGSSSLSYLRRFSLSKLKIDRSFIDEIENRPQDAEIIPAIIAVARSLRLRVVAEGVETAAQLRFLQAHGCDEFQGYLDSEAKAQPDLTPRRR